MKKMTRALMAGTALLAAVCVTGCSVVEDLTKAKYEAENTIEDVYPNLED